MLIGIIIKLLKTKDKVKKIWKAPNKKCHLIEEKPLETWYHSQETMGVRKKWYKNFQVLEEKNCQPTILYPVQISFRMLQEHTF